MKKILYIFMLSLVAIACKKEIKNDTTEDAQLYRGEFIYTEQAAVLKGKDFLYGVELDEKAKELATKTKPLQREEFDMVPVVIKGILKDNPKEGWDHIVQITEIIGVENPTSDLITKIKSPASEKTEVEATTEKQSTEAETTH